MHIEPGIVDGAKMALSYGTALAAFGVAGKLAVERLREAGGLPALAVGSVITTALVFCFFQVLPHYPVGVSEVHFILGAVHGLGGRGCGRAALAPSHGYAGRIQRGIEQPVPQ